MYPGGQTAAYLRSSIALIIFRGLRAAQWFVVLPQVVENQVRRIGVSLVQRCFVRGVRKGPGTEALVKPEPGHILFAYDRVR